jgi:hypothetical protein
VTGIEQVVAVDELISQLIKSDEKVSSLYLIVIV